MSRFNRTIDKLLVLNDGTSFAVTLDAYTANDVVGGLCKVVYGTSFGAELRRISITDHAVQSEPYRIHIYKSIPTTIANDAAFAPTDDDGDVEIADEVLAAGDYVTANGSAYSKAHLKAVDLDIPESCNGTIYVYLECTATPDYAAVTDLVIEFTFWVEQD